MHAMTSHPGGGGKPSLIPSLSREGSIYSFTLNEVQIQLGEPLHSMNLDELLLPAESDTCLDMNIGGASGHHGPGSGFQRQGSSTMTRAVSRKTVDEVWRDIQQVQNNTGEERASGHERHPTLGEMTLEDFLMKAGVSKERADQRMGNPVCNVGPVVSDVAGAEVQGSTLGTRWPQQYHQMHHQQQQAQQSMMRSYVHPEGQGAISFPLVGTMLDPQSPLRKRGASEDVVEKGVERRQKRMIKNRESAARSRARKEAYMSELEHKVSRLEQENERLKKRKVETDPNQRTTYNTFPCDEVLYAARLRPSIEEEIKGVTPQAPGERWEPVGLTGSSAHFGRGGGLLLMAVFVRKLTLILKGL